MANKQLELFPIATTVRIDHSAGAFFRISSCVSVNKKAIIFVQLSTAWPSTWRELSSISAFTSLLTSSRISHRKYCLRLQWALTPSQMFLLSKPIPSDTYNDDEAF